MVVILSALTGPLLVATPHVDASPCPRVEVFAVNMDPAVASVSVYRAAAGAEMLVRGAVRASTVGALTRVDFEVPFGVPVTYRAEMFDAAGVSLGFISSSPVTLLVRDTWLHNPLEPHGATVVELAPSTGAELSRPVRAEVSRPLGRRVGVVLSETRSGLTGFSFDVRATTLDTADRVQAMLGTAEKSLPPVLCIRPGAGVPLRVTNPLFLGVMDIVEVGLDVRWGGQNTVQQMRGDEVAPPVPGLFIPLLTRADVNAYYATRAELNTDNAARADVNRKYDIAGYATQGG